MTRRNPPLSLCALAVVALMAHGTSMAAPSDEELSRIKVYGNVTLAQDSASQWGPWEQFEAPNAGPAPVVFMPSAVAEVYRPVALINPADSLNPCAAGGICGFGAFITYSYGGQERSAGNSSVSTADNHPYAFTADVLEDNPLNVGEVMVKSLEGLPPGLVLHKQLLSATGTLINPDSPPLGQYGSGYRNQDYSSYMFMDGYRNRFLDGMEGEIEATWYQGADSIQGADGSYEMQPSWGVAGFVTTAEGMAEAQRQALTRESPIVNYVGHDYYAASSEGYASANVQIAVNFGTRTFDATFNGGTDKSVQTSSTASGGTQLTGQVGFVASGNITGSTFQSTSVSATDATSISGKVTGAFFGTNAAAAGGVADITKTVAAVVPAVVPVNQEVAQTLMVVMPTPQITKPGYTNARFVSPFLTVQENLIRSRD
jgi:hypothetical protein